MLRRILSCLMAVILGSGLYTPLAMAKKPPIECTDPDYDMNDCEKAEQLREWVKKQEKAPDHRRLRVAGIDEDVLVEQATGFRMGLHKMRIPRLKDRLTGVRFGAPGNWKMFMLGSADGCELGNYVEVVRNTADFTLFSWACAYMLPTSRIRKLSFDYLLFDKRYDRLDAIVQGVSGQSTEPSLTRDEGVYKFRWTYKNAGDKPFHVYYDFKITGNRPQDLKCLKSWNDECDIALRDGPLKPNEYKILDE